MTKLSACVAAGLVLAGSSLAPAAVLTQLPGMTDSSGKAYFALEAEDYDSIIKRTGSGTTNVIWSTLTDANASGGKALLANDGVSGDTSGASGDKANIVTYKLVFSVPGTYTLYWRGRAAGSADGVDGTPSNNDSFFAPATFNDVNPAVVINGSGSGTGGTLKVGDTSGNYATTYAWFVQNTSSVNLVVTPDDVAHGTVLSLTFGTREDGLVIDRWVLSLNAGLTTATLGTLANASVIPAPAALPAGLALLGLVATHRRRA